MINVPACPAGPLNRTLAGFLERVSLLERIINKFLVARHKRTRRGKGLRGGREETVTGRGAKDTRRN